MSTKVTFSTDVLARSIWHHMVSDFRTHHGHNFAAGADLAFGRGVQNFRDYEWPLLGLMSKSRFKAHWQLRHLFKAYRFEHDKYTDQELIDRSNLSYIEFQNSVKLLDINNPIVFRVLQEARKIAKEILGPYDAVAMLDHARFGKRSSIGCAFRDAYIDYKLSVPDAFTSTAKARQWFFTEYLPNDVVLQRIVKKLFRTAKAKKKAFNFVCRALNLVSVPKSWKTLRTITPLSLIELFYTFAVGGLITDRLAEHGLNIRYLQEIHKRLAQKGSLPPDHEDWIDIATVDFSRASDSILSQLLRAMLETDWYNALRAAFCRHVKVDGRVMATHTVLPMGNGFTFPVETLVFYCLAKAVGNLTRIHGCF